MINEYLILKKLGIYEKLFDIYSHYVGRDINPDDPYSLEDSFWMLVNDDDFYNTPQETFYIEFGVPKSFINYLTAIASSMRSYRRYFNEKVGEEDQDDEHRDDSSGGSLNNIFTTLIDYTGNTLHI